jgi:hypothetical protein
MTDKHQGTKYVQGRNTAEVAKLFRAEVKELCAKGELPKGLKLSVRVKRFAGGSSIDIHVTAAPGIDVLNPAYIVAREAIPSKYIDHPRGRYNQSQAAQALVAKLEGIIQQYQRMESDSQTDYYSTNFYDHVSLHSDLQRDEAKRLADAHAELIREIREVTAKVDMDAAVAQCLSLAA